MVALTGPGSSYTTSQQQSAGQQTSTSFIPNFSQTPILENIAQYAEQMAPQVYQWGLDQYNKNQGNIDAMMQQAQTYASPERIKAEMGMAEAGVAQAGEAARQSSLSDLQSYGIDPSSGRYAELDQANRVQTAAAAAGAGNQQRMATQATGNALQQQALSSSLQNVATGYGAAQGMTNLLGTGMQLKYSPLGTASQGTTESTGSSLSQTAGQYGTGGLGTGNYWMRQSGAPAGGPGVAKGGFISPDLSQSHGEAVDDVPARLNAGEFVIPKDIVEFKGKEFFYKLIAQARKNRATGQQPQQGTGYQQGGTVTLPGDTGDPATDQASQNFDQSIRNMGGTPPRMPSSPVQFNEDYARYALGMPEDEIARRKAAQTGDVSDQLQQVPYAPGAGTPYTPSVGPPPVIRQMYGRPQPVPYTTGYQDGGDVQPAYYMAPGNTGPDRFLYNDYARPNTGPGSSPAIPPQYIPQDYGVDKPQQLPSDPQGGAGNLRYGRFTQRASYMAPDNTDPAQREA